MLMYILHILMFIQNRYCKSVNMHALKFVSNNSCSSSNLADLGVLRNHFTSFIIDLRYQ